MQELFITYVDLRRGDQRDRKPWNWKTISSFGAPPPSIRAYYNSVIKIHLNNYLFVGRMVIRD